MVLPHFLKGHKPTAGDAALFEKSLADTYAANVWVRELRATDTHDVRYDVLGKALVWELRNSGRRSVIELLRGAYNRARIHVEKDQLLELMNE